MDNVIVVEPISRTNTSRTSNDKSNLNFFKEQREVRQEEDKIIDEAIAVFYSVDELARITGKHSMTIRKKCLGRALNPKFARKQGSKWQIRLDWACQQLNLDWKKLEPDPENNSSPQSGAEMEELKYINNFNEKLIYDLEKRLDYQIRSHEQDKVMIGQLLDQLRETREHFKTLTEQSNVLMAQFQKQIESLVQNQQLLLEKVESYRKRPKLFGIF